MSAFYANPVLLTLTLAATLLAAAILVSRFRMAAATMLLIPWAWAVGTFALIAAANWYGILAQQNRIGLFGGTYGALHFFAACGTLCPFVALIGAKRPQHSAWSFVVLAFWGMISLPAVEVILLHPGQDLEINSIRSLFLLGLIVAELCNFVLTRYGISSLLLAAAQFFWLGPWLPWRFSPMWLDREVAGQLLVSAAVISAWLISLRETRAANTYDSLWCDFRDSFGLFWSLRLIERVNDTAKQAGWDFDLGWSGFRTKSDFQPLSKLPPEIDAALRNCLQGSLRRFVSQEWITQRLREGVESAATESTP
jgi:hypothetical protein